MAAAAAVPSFFMYTSPELDFSWLRGCDGFAALLRTSYRERLAEVELHASLAAHERRVVSAHEAKLFYVPVWELASFRVGACNGTTHAGRMARAARALRAAPAYSLGSPRGTDHFMVSSGCIEANRRAAERLGALAAVLSHAIVGRDRAYSSFYKASAVGRCTIEIPYVSNAAIPAVASTPAYAAHEEAAASRERGRRWLLSFHGSLDVCCEPGRTVRRAARALIGAHNDTLVAHVPRKEYSQAEQEAAYREQAEAMLSSTFCLVPAGDNEVSSRLYSSIAAGCIPVVIANQLSGAFASVVPYHLLWLRVEEAAFVAHPRALLPRLRALTAPQIAARRAALRAHAADVLYAAPNSRVASNFLRAAADGCLAGKPSSLLGLFPPDHAYAHDRNFGVNCSCVRRPPRFWWQTSNARLLYAGRGKAPTEQCRCLHCATLCPHNATTDGQQGTHRARAHHSRDAM
ncbi:hypothetical protein AB1Y20_000019 [Prymnesium parvum]|uniref:Exostosin GT47 domain-containing protein n=1 Tax=Prymnesium parvum TaxID=97485 RepID=A0AB34K499_PRYPA